jgi:transglutaminase-like putative cysteine protease
VCSSRSGHGSNDYRVTAPVRLPVDALTDPRHLRPTRLTAPDLRLRELACELGRGQATPLELADRICRTVHSAMTYEYGVTSVHTSTGDALAVRRGLYQDPTHIMLVLLR